MEYVYAAMLLHKAGNKVDEASMKKVLEAAGVKADAARIKALVASLDGVDIDEAVKSAAIAPVASAPTASSTDSAAQDKKEDEEKEEEKNEEQAAAGLGALFG
ncbi:MAG: 50S ribosomal protein P1 [Nanoarchaeota archaeon]|nr:50S ribosomal protein P1 [Nanoarchaeota archaeon]